MDEFTVRPVEGQGSIKPVDHFKSTNLVKATKTVPVGKDTQDGEEKQAIFKDIDISEVVKKMNEFVDAVGTKISFTFDEKTKRPIIIVAEKDSGKIIRQIPPEEMLVLIQKMEEIAGILFNRRV